MIVGITGASGFIGQYVLEELSKQHSIIAATSNNNKIIESKKSIKYVLVDYSLDSYIEAFKGCDAVIHLGARIQYDLNTDKQTIDTYIKNILSSENLFNACCILGISNIIWTSSTTVYNKRPDEIYDEKMPVVPLTYYGFSKASSELLAQMYNINKNMQIKTLRLAYVFGYSDSPNIQNTVVMKYFKKAINGENLPVYGDGSSSNVYIYVRDVVAAILKALEVKNCSGIFNIGNNYNTTTLELAEAFCKVFPNVDYYYVSDKKQSGLSWNISTLKAKTQLGFNPQFSLNDAITDMKKRYEEK